MATDIRSERTRPAPVSMKISGSSFLSSMISSVVDHEPNLFSIRDGTYINISNNQVLNEKFKQLTGLSNLDALYLVEDEIMKMFKNCLL